jgi:PAS domain S-box-containing protein
MKHGTMERKIQVAQHRLESLWQRIQKSPEPQKELFAETLQELGLALEELQLSQEELRQRNKELASTSQALARERQHYTELFDHAPDGYLVTDPEGVIREANRAAGALLQVRHKFLIGKPLSLYVAAEQRKDLCDLLTRLSQKKEKEVREWGMLMAPREGPPFPAAVTITTIHDGQSDWSSESLTGSLIGLRWLVRDITNRVVQTENVRRQSEEQFRLLVEGVKDYAIFMLDPEGVIVSWNTGAERIKGYRPEEILGKHFSCFYSPQDMELGKPQRGLEAAAAEGRFADEGWRLRKDGSLFWASVVITALRDESGSLRGFSKVTRDITERKNTEDKLRRQAELLDLVHDAIFVRDLENRVVFWNSAAQQIYGWTADEALGKEVHILLQTVFPQPLEIIKATVLRNGSWEGEVIHTRRDGERIVVESCWVLQKSRDGFPIEILTINRDISDRKRAEKQIRENLRRITALRDINVAITSTLDLQSVLSLLLEKLEDFFPYPTAMTVRLFNRETGELERLFCRNIDPAEWKAGAQSSPGGRDQEAIRIKAPVAVRNVQLDPRSHRPDFYSRMGLVSSLAVPLIVKEDVRGILSLYTREEHEFSGEEIEFLSSLAVQAAIAIHNTRLYEQLIKQAVELERAHDELEERVRERTFELARTNDALKTEISERKRVEEQLRESERQLSNLAKGLEQQLIASDRLVSVGELAASIAHEFNNPLQIILGFTQEVLSELNPSQPHYEILKIVETATLRCGEIIRNLLDFARPDHDLSLSVVEPIIRNSIKLTLAHLEQSKIKVEIDAQPDLPEIYADPTQLQQVLINLFFNAADAMPKGGTLTIRAAANPASSVQADENREASRQELTIAVSDTGTGIHREALPNIFRPFFTTKKKKGMGLGLSICERIMKAHGGRVTVDSARGKGTTFYLHFPLMEARDYGRAS